MYKRQQYGNHARQLVEEKAEQFDLLLCCGGDGTWNEVISGLMKVAQKPAVAYLPTGTVNAVSYTHLFILPSILIEAGIASFKIEGRMKRPEYVALMCDLYRKAIDAYTRKETFHVDAAMTVSYTHLTL